MTDYLASGDLVTGEVLAARLALSDGLHRLAGVLRLGRNRGQLPAPIDFIRGQVRSAAPGEELDRTPSDGPRPAGAPRPGTTRTTVRLPGHAPRRPGPAPSGTPDRDRPVEPPGEVWQLVQRAQNGDSDAFGQLYDRYVDTVFRFIYFRVASRPLAEDLTSETFLRALKRISSFTWQGRDLGAWLVTIARNLVADHFKSGRYRLEITSADVLEADREDRAPEGSPEAVVLDRMTNATLLEAIKRLNPEQQECISMRFLQSFSVAETAEAMGKNEGAIKALQYRAVRALARLLPEGFAP